MKVFKSKHTLVETLGHYRAQGKTIGLVPTMGMLHKGHLSLVSKAVEENDLAVCSIFVNPTQFNNKEDFDKYPKNIDADLELLNGVGCDVVFIPDQEQMYPDGASGEDFDFGDLTKNMEGKFRPGHFSGVAAIVKRLTSLVKPDRSYYGEKDYQQLLVVKSLFQKMGFKGEVIGCDILREKCGLAMSSRNERLSEGDKRKACFLYECLSDARDLLFRSEPKAVEAEIKSRFLLKPEFELEYFVIADEQTLKPLNHGDLSRARIFTAAHLSGVRLIDNLKV